MTPPGMEKMLGMQEPGKCPGVQRPVTMLRVLREAAFQHFTSSRLNFVYIRKKSYVGIQAKPTYFK